MSTAKRSYSPSIDDIRQYNIKRQRLLDDLDNLTLASNTSSGRSTPQPISTRDTEFIPDIDDFLIHNQDDQDILETSSHVIDMDHYNKSNLIIPTKITNLKNLTKQDAQFSFDRISGRRKFQNKFNRFDGNIQVTNDDILLDYEVLKHWSLIKYWNPYVMIYQIWEKWYFNEYKLGQFDSEFYNGRVEFLPDDYTGPIDLDDRSNIAEENDVIIDDIYELNETNELKQQEQPDTQTDSPINDYGDYYGNLSHQTPYIVGEVLQDGDDGDDDVMDLD